MMRQIKDVVGTSDGRHVVIICTDGSIMYFRRHENESTDIFELNSLQCEPEMNQSWMIRRVGQDGHAVLLRAMRTTDESTTKPSSTSIRIDLLESIASEVQSTHALLQPWNPWGYYTRATPASTLPSENKDPNSTGPAASVESKSSAVTPKVSVKRLVVNAKILSQSASASKHRETPSSLARILQPSPHSSLASKSKPSSSLNKLKSMQTPEMMSTGALSQDTPMDEGINRLVYHQREVSPKRSSARTLSTQVTDRPVEILPKRTRERSVNFQDLMNSDQDGSSYEGSYYEDEVQSKRLKAYRQPIIPKLVESNAVIVSEHYHTR
jgi:hypothetical protein